jgi:hypothetical protein
LKKLPETISNYNKTEFEVDETDQMAKKYTLKSGFRRWPFRLFYILDLAEINAWILYKIAIGEKILRKVFLFRLSKNGLLNIKMQGKRGTFKFYVKNFEE